MTVKQYERKLKAANTITSFMGTLASRYTAKEMKLMWKRLEVMVGRYGMVFVADAIGKDRTGAELALLRYGR